MSKEMDEEDQLLADSSDESEEEEGQGQGDVSNRTNAATFFGQNENEEDDSSSSEEEEEEEDMDVDEEAMLQELSVVNDKLASEPYSYDLHLEKIKILKALGDVDRLRGARERMSQLYPLTPALWIEWLEDEVKMMSVATEEEKQGVFNLCERAVKDYVSVEVWIQYANLCMSQMGDETGIQRCRDVFERAIAACGLHVTMGCLIWDMYKDFEAAMLGVAQSEEQQLEQEKRYIALCKRQLAVPLLDMRNSYEQIKSRIDLDGNTETAYKKALERLQELDNWEAKVVQASEDSKKLEVYMEYVAAEKKAKSNPARIQCLYERAITDSPLSANLWLDYIDYLTKTIKIPDVVFSVCERASRNCPWHSSVWSKYLWAAETLGGNNFPDDSSTDDSTFEKVKSIFENALNFCSTGEQAGTLWLKYLEFLRRRIEYDKPNVKKLEVLKKTFFAAEAHLLQLVEEPNDYVSQILQFQARLEAHLAKSMTEDVRTMWKNIFARGYGQYTRVWLNYFVLEMRYGMDIKRIRTELSKAVSQVQDDLQSIADFWLNFERDFGDLSSLAAAESKITSRLEKMTYTQTQTYDQEVPQRSFASPGKGKKRKWNATEDVEAVGAPVPARKEKASDTKVSEQNNSPFKVPELPGRKKFKDSMDTTKDALSKGIVVPPVAAPAPVKHDPSKDHRTVFVSNLDFQVEEDRLASFFKDCGTVEEVRLVRDFKSRSKGFGYVVFKSHDSIQKALAMDRQPCNNRPVFVSKCDPDKTTRQAQFKYPTRMETNKLFVKNLPLSFTQEDLTKMFEPFGALKDCRLITYRNGHSKGIAYVEFQDSNHASAALVKTDGAELEEGMKISVAISNPPARGAVKPLSFQSSARHPDPGQRRERNVFVPRSIQVKPSKSDDPITTTTPKSNEEFRKLFMK